MFANLKYGFEFLFQSCFVCEWDIKSRTFHCLNQTLHRSCLQNLASPDLDVLEEAEVAVIEDVTLPPVEAPLWAIVLGSVPPENDYKLCKFPLTNLWPVLQTFYDRNIQL